MQEQAHEWRILFLRAGAFADESHVVDTVGNDVSTDHVEDYAQSVREGSVVGSEIGEVPDAPVECEIPGRDVRNTVAFLAARQSLNGVFWWKSSPVAFAS